MHNIFRRKLSLFLAFVMCLSLAPIGAFADGEETGETLIEELQLAETVPEEVPPEETLFAAAPQEELPHEHAFEQSGYTAPTCEGEGSILWLCPCGESYEEPLSATGHGWQLTDAAEATATEAGYETYTCSLCGSIYTDYTEPTGVAEEPQAEELPAPEEPAVEEPVVEEPAAETEAAAPETEAPAEEEPAAAVPVTAEPAAETEAETPETEMPAMEAPAAEVAEELIATPAESFEEVSNEIPEAEKEAPTVAAAETPVITITVQPENTETVNGVAVFSVTASVAPADAELTYQWQQLDSSADYASAEEREAAWQNITNETGDTFRLTGLEDQAALEAALRNVYRCVITAGPVTSITEAAALNPVTAGETSSDAENQQSPVDSIVRLAPDSGKYINPLFRDFVSEDDLRQPRIFLKSPLLAGSNEYLSLSDASVQLRKEMKQRSESFVIKYTYQSDAYLNPDNLFDPALAHNSVPDEGDYLSFSLMSYAWYIDESSYNTGNSYYLTVTFSCRYTDTYAQEQETAAKVSSILASLNLNGKSSYEKAKAIYDYLTDTVSYDRSYSYYSGYDALVRRCAVCQGIAVAFYRLALSAGLDARFVSSVSMNHGWNIVGMDGVYYYLDATWDLFESRSAASYSYFLIGRTNWIKSHSFGDEFSDGRYSSYLVPDADYSGPVNGYYIKYDANGGINVPPTQLKQPGVALTLSKGVPTYTGYEFLGWATSKTATSAAYQPGGKFTIDAHTTLYAVWKIKTYTVTYNANGGSGAPAAQTKTHGKALTLSTTRPTRTGYTFQGWGTSAASGVLYQPGGSYTANTAVTLYAVWKINTFTVSYNANGGSGAPGAQTKTYGKTLTLNTAKPTRTGYTFQGWATSSSATSAAYQPGGSYTANAAVTLYAVWKQNITPEQAKKNFIERLYNVCLGRGSSGSEKEYYMWLLNDQGKTGVSVAYEFIFSDEFKMKNYCDKHYVIALYEAFMGREPAGNEIDNWVWRLQQGDSRETVFNQFALSSEFGGICKEAGIKQGSAVSVSGKGTKPGGYCTVSGCTAKNKLVEFATRLYTVCLNRRPGQNEVDAWHYYFVHGDHTGTSASKFFLFSEEFQSKRYSDKEFVKHLYDAMMGRNGKYTADELNYWCWELGSNGMTREKAFEQFAASDEFKVICQQYGVNHH